MNREQLKALAASGDEVELNIRVRATILRVSDAHGVCARVILERRDYGTVDDVHDGRTVYASGDPRAVWLDEDEIVEVQV